MTEEISNAVDVQPVVSEEDNEELKTKHPLQNEWDFWYFKPNKKHNWSDNLLKIHSFNTVEDFWALYNHIELPSRLQLGSDYNLFKQDISPMWEDSANQNGGRLIILFKKGSSKDYPKELRMLEDKIWLEACLCLIGETFGPESDKINGVVFNSRPKFDRISIWTSDWKDEEGVTKIAQTLKNRTGFNDRLYYEKHGDDKLMKTAPLYTF